MEEELLFDQTMRKIEFLFRYAGLNIKSGEQSISNRWKSRIIFFFNLFWLDVDLSGGIYWFIDGVKTGKDFLELTYIAPCISFSTLANVKGIFLILNEKHIHNLIGNLRNLEMSQRNRPQSLVKDEIIEQEKKFLDLILNTFNIAYVALVAVFTLSPFVLMGLKYFQMGELELLLPFLILYPFDPFQMKVWPFVYLHQFWSECVDCLNLLSSDFLFFICCTYIRIQFRLLQQEFENIIEIGNTNRKFLENEDFERHLNELIIWHQDIIEATNNMEAIYSKSTLFNFISSSLVICLTGFNVTVMMNEDLSFILVFLCFLFMSLVQVYFLCYFADLLMTSSTDIGDAVYNSQWYAAEAKIVKKLFIIITRAQLPCKITAWAFADINLNSFMRVLSTSYSYFALLQTMYGN